MYQMTPIYLRPGDDIAGHTNTVVKAVLLAVAAVAIITFALAVLAATHMAWLSLLNRYGAESAPVIFRLLLSGL